MADQIFSDAEFYKLRSHYNGLAKHLQDVYLNALNDTESDQIAMLNVVKHLEVLEEMGKLDLQGVTVFVAYMIRRSAQNQTALVKTMN